MPLPIILREDKIGVATFGAFVFPATPHLVFQATAAEKQVFLSFVQNFGPGDKVSLFFPASDGSIGQKIVIYSLSR